MKDLTNKQLLTIIGVSLFSWAVLEYIEKCNKCPKCNGTGRKSN